MRQARRWSHQPISDSECEKDQRCKAILILSWSVLPAPSPKALRSEREHSLSARALVWRVRVLSGDLPCRARRPRHCARELQGYEAPQFDCAYLVAWLVSVPLDARISGMMKSIRSGWTQWILSVQGGPVEHPEPKSGRWPSPARRVPARKRSRPVEQKDASSLFHREPAL